MRRRPGIAGLQASQGLQARAPRHAPFVSATACVPACCTRLTRRARAPSRPQSQYRAVGAAAAEVADAHMRDKLTQFKASLEAFALKYRRGPRGTRHAAWRACVRCLPH